VTVNGQKSQMHGLDGHFRSLKRVRAQGEVFTQPREIGAMLALISEAFEDIGSSFLEPAAGSGNFLPPILRRKVEKVSELEHGGTPSWYEFAVLRCLSSIYAIDIDAENVEEARQRLLTEVSKLSSGANFLRAAGVILATNIICGDSLKDSQEILLVEYRAIENETFERPVHYLSPPDLDLFFVPPEPLPAVHFSELGLESGS